MAFYKSHLMRLEWQSKDVKNKVKSHKYPFCCLHVFIIVSMRTYPNKNFGNIHIQTQHIIVGMDNYTKA